MSVVLMENSLFASEKVKLRVSCNNSWTFEAPALKKNQNSWLSHGRLPTPVPSLDCSGHYNSRQFLHCYVCVPHCWHPWEQHEPLIATECPTFPCNWWMTCGFNPALASIIAVLFHSLTKGLAIQYLPLHLSSVVWIDPCNWQWYGD